MRSSFTKLVGRTESSRDLQNVVPGYSLDVRGLKENEFIEFLYDSKGKVLGFQKLELQSARGACRAETDIVPGGLGQVWHKGTYWRAKCEGEYKILKGQTALVLGIQKSTLIVRADIAN